MCPSKTLVSHIYPDPTETSLCCDSQWIEEYQPKGPVSHSPLITFWSKIEALISANEFHLDANILLR